MKVLFTIAYIQYTIGLQLYLLKRYIDKVTESGFQAIKVSGDVAKWVIVVIGKRLIHLVSNFPLPLLQSTDWYGTPYKAVDLKKAVLHLFSPVTWSADSWPDNLGNTIWWWIVSLLIPTCIFAISHFEVGWIERQLRRKRGHKKRERNLYLLRLSALELYFWG